MYEICIKIKIKISLNEENTFSFKFFTFSYWRVVSFPNFDISERVKQTFCKWYIFFIKFPLKHKKRNLINRLGFFYRHILYVPPREIFLRHRLYTFFHSFVGRFCGGYTDEKRQIVKNEMNRKDFASILRYD